MGTECADVWRESPHLGEELGEQNRRALLPDARVCMIPPCSTPREMSWHSPRAGSVVCGDARGGYSTALRCPTRIGCVATGSPGQNGHWLGSRAPSERLSRCRNMELPPAGHARHNLHGLLVRSKMITGTLVPVIRSGRKLLRNGGAASCGRSPRSGYMCAPAGARPGISTARRIVQVPPTHSRCTCAPNSIHSERYVYCNSANSESAHGNNTNDDVPKGCRCPL